MLNTELQMATVGVAEPRPHSSTASRCAAHRVVDREDDGDPTVQVSVLELLLHIHRVKDRDEGGVLTAGDGVHTAPNLGRGGERGGGREWGREGVREGGGKGGREGRREGRREGSREGRREGMRD